MNLAYKVIMAILAGVSLMLATMTDTDTLYYQFVSVFSSAFPVVWSQVLDASKEYINEETPTTLSPASSSERFSERNTPKAESPHPHDLNDATENTV